ncbi:Exopolyphosphatase [Tilletia horrida]|uniref:Exopolyphosphatase n=1 Tax=Tilletia horrida TaxID=155126 RepID=A0AAN6G9Z6_9BASI|nr:Exopolyphosphatase [Tilletia horrida]
MADASFVSAAHIATRFPSASSFHAAAAAAAPAPIDEDELARTAAANARFTQPLSTALSILKTSVVGAVDARHVPGEASSSTEPWRPLQQPQPQQQSLDDTAFFATAAVQGKHPRVAVPTLAELPADFPIDFPVSRNGQNLRDLFRRDYKEVQLHLHVASDPFAFNIGFASIPLSMARLLTKDPTPGAPIASGRINAESRATDRWQAWWYSLAAWMDERKLGMMVVGTSYRDEKDRHKRELVVAYTPTYPLPPNFWPTFTSLLLSDAHVPDHSHASAYTQRLLLESEWKGERLQVPLTQQTDKAVLKVGDKRERVGGLDAARGDRWEFRHDARLPVLHAAVWKQANDKANRKIFLPAITWAVEQAASAGKGR